MTPFALQLYTVRDYLTKDALGTLKKVKAMGYNNVELFGVGAAQAAEWKAMLDEAGLQAISAHVMYEEVVKDTPGIIEAAKLFGMKNVVVPYLKLETAEKWQEAAVNMDKAGAQIREAGLQLSYHNHAHEYEKIGDKTAMDIIYSTASKENLFAQLDLFWVKLAGTDIVDELKKFAGRCTMVHVKDMAEEGSRRFAPVGDGIIDWAPVFKQAFAQDVQWFITEQDECEGDSLESAARSAAYMAKA